MIQKIIEEARTGEIGDGKVFGKIKNSFLINLFILRSSLHDPLITSHLKAQICSEHQQYSFLEKNIWIIVICSHLSSLFMGSTLKYEENHFFYLLRFQGNQLTGFSFR